MGPIETVGMRVGLGSTVLSLGALAGPPISGAIFAHAGNFKPVGYYAGQS